MRLENYLDPARALVFEGVSDVDDLLSRLAAAASAAGVDESALRDALRAREASAPTSTPEGVAFPHALLEGVSETIVVAAKVPGGVVMGKADHPPADVVFCMVGSAESPWDHVRLLARLARIARGEGALDRIRASSTDAELFDALLTEDRAHA